MARFEDVDRAVRDAIKSGRVGRPVFVRVLAGGAAARDETNRTAAAVRDAAATWLDDAVDDDRSRRVDGDRAGGSAQLLRTRGGATAVIAPLGSADDAGIVDVLLLGNRGGAYFEGVPADGDRKSPAPPSDVAPAKRANAARRYGVLLVTGGRTHQENYARAFAVDPRAKLIALADERGVTPLRRELNERLARELDVPHVADLDAAIRRDDVDVVSICAEPERRGRIIERAARAGKHLYLDKSLCPTLDGSDAIVAAVRAAGVRSHMFSFVPQPWARRAKAAIDAGELGDLVAIHVDTHFAKGRAGTAKLGTPRREQFPPRPETFQRPEAKREMDNVAVYGVSLVRWLTGRDCRSVWAATSNYFFEEHQKADVEDFAVLSLALDGGVNATISAGRIGWTSHPAAGSNRVIVVGSKRTLAFDANRPRLEIADDQPPWTPPPVNPADPMGFWKSTMDEVHTMPKLAWQPLAATASDAAYFLDCLDAGRDSEMSAAAAAATTEVLLAAYKSAATGAVVELPLDRA